MKSYFTFLSRNKLYTAIETFGMATALSFVVILGFYARMEYSVGRGNAKAKEIYAVGMGRGDGMTWGTSQEFFPSMPEIQEWTRVGYVDDMSGFVVDGTYFKANAYTVDPNFFDFFGYDVRGCRRDRVLTAEDEAIVSASFASKVFGSEDPIGRTLKYDTLSFRITGVMPDFGSADVFNPYEVMLPMAYTEKHAPRMDTFGSTIPFVRLAGDADPDKVAEKLLDKYVDYWDFYTRTDEHNGLWGSSLVRLDQLYFSDNSYYMLRKGNRSLVDVLLAVALVLLMCAVFNYINLTVAQAGKRAKEMATRRLLGERASGIVWRYFKESVLFTTVCFLMALLLAFCLLPVFNEILSTHISFAFSPLTLSFIVAALLVVSAICGIIPAMVVLSFSPIDVVKGSLRMKSRMWFSKVFITMQGIVSTILIAVGLTMTLQMYHLYNLPYGYDKEDVILAYTSEIGTTLERQQILVDRLKALPEVEEAVPGSGSPILCSYNSVHDEKGEMKSWVRMCRLDSIGMKMLGIKVLEQYGEPTDGKIWVTESGKHFWGVSAQRPYLGDNARNVKLECCGVITDFRAGSAMSTAMKDSYNAVMVMPRGGSYYTMLIKTRGDHGRAKEAVRKTLREVATELTGIPFQMSFRYMDEFLEVPLRSQRNTMSLVLSFMLVSVLISALGMFAMSVYYSEQQRKQIALRKVMGATVASAAWTLSRRFLVMSVAAIVLAMPLSVKAMRYYLEDFSIQIPMPWWVLAAAAFFTLLTAFLSIISRTMKAAKTNPIESVKTE